MAAETVDRETGEIVAAPETLEFPPVRVDKKFVINQQGKDFVLVPGKGGDFATLTREQYLPAAKKAGVTDYLVFVTNYGGLINSRSTVEYLSKFADLDAGNPVARAMGPEAFQKFNQQRAALITSNESAVFSFVPEASYGAPAPPK